MDSVPGRPDRNLSAAEERIRHAAAQGSTLVVLPECAVNGYDLDWFRSGAPGAQPYPGDPFERLASLSAELGTAVALADLEAAGAGLYDSALIFEAGRLVSRHRKMIPTERESAAGLRAGEAPAQPVGLQGAGMVVGPMVCYEYAFPQIARDLAGAGARLLAVSSAVRDGFDHLIPVRLRARAQDNSCFVVMANAVGHGFCGRSLIVNPLGDVMAEAPTGREQTLFADVDPAAIGDVPADAAPSSEEHARVMTVLGRRPGSVQHVSADLPG